MKTTRRPTPRRRASAARLILLLLAALAAGRVRVEIGPVDTPPPPAARPR